MLCYFDIFYVIDSANFTMRTHKHDFISIKLFNNGLFLRFKC